MTSDNKNKNEDDPLEIRPLKSDEDDALDSVPFDLEEEGEEKRVVDAQEDEVQEAVLDADAPDFEEVEGLAAPVLEAEAVVEPDMEPDIEDDLTADFDVDAVSDDMEITGDPGVDFADEADFMAQHDKAAGKKKWMMSAALGVLLLGGGGYFAYDAMIAGQRDPLMVTSYAAPESFDVAEDSSVGAAFDGYEDELEAALLPQPMVNQNQVPRSPEEDLTGSADDDFMVMAQADPLEPAWGGDDTDISGLFAADEDSADHNEVEDITGQIAEQTQTEMDLPEDDVEAYLSYGEGSEQGEDVSAYALELSEENQAAAPPPLEEDVAPVSEPVVMQSAPVQDHAAQDDVVQGRATNIEDAQFAPERPAQEAGASEVQVGVADGPVTPIEAEVDGPTAFFDGVSHYAMTPPPGDVLRNVDPVTEPASKFVVVQKDREINDYDSLVIAADRALRLQRYEAALDMYETLARRNPRDQRVLMGLAIARQNTGQPEMAARAYDQILALNPDNKEAMINMLGLLRTQYPSVALRRLMDLRARYPQHAGIAAQMGLIYGENGHYEDAMRYLQMASSIEPRNALHIFNMAITADRAGNVVEAIRHYENALEVDAVYGGGRSISRDVIYDRLSSLRRR